MWLFFLPAAIFVFVVTIRILRPFWATRFHCPRCWHFEYRDFARCSSCGWINDLYGSRPPLPKHLPPPEPPEWFKQGKKRG
jgi:hypothetical protein